MSFLLHETTTKIPPLSNGGIFVVVTNLTPNASEQNIKSDMPSVVAAVTGFHMVIANVEGQIVLCHGNAGFGRPCPLVQYVITTDGRWD